METMGMVDVGSLDSLSAPERSMTVLPLTLVILYVCPVWIGDIMVGSWVDRK
jgi:hypothetical protein